MGQNTLILLLLNQSVKRLLYLLLPIREVAGNDRILSWTLYGHWHHGGYVTFLHSLRFVFQPMAAMDCGETFQTFPVVPKSLMFHPCKELFQKILGNTF